MLRVLHVIRATSLAGAESHVVDLLESLRERGIDAQLALLTRRDRPLHEYHERLRARRIPVHAFTQHGHINPHLFWWLHRLMRSLGPQIVHTHLLDADLYGALAAKTAGVPVLVSSRHGMNSFRRRQPFRSMNRQLWRMVDGGIAVSQAMADFLMQFEGAPAEKLRVIHYGLNLKSYAGDASAELRRKLCAELDIDETGPLLAMACRLIELKGVSYALQAFAPVLAEFPLAQLIIAGDGVMRSQLESEARQAGLGASVQFLGWRDDVPEVMAACDLFVLPSLSEGLGLVYLEAMAQELPVVAARISAVTEVVVEGETGLLVPTRDVPALRDALLTLLRDRPLARRMGIAGRQRFKAHFQIDRMVDNTVALYDELLSRP